MEVDDVLIPIDARDFRYFVEEKIKNIEEDIAYYKGKIEEAHKNYEKKLEKYNSKPWFIRLFMIKPVKPNNRPGIISQIDIWEAMLIEKKAELHRVERILKNLPQSGKIQISDQELRYFNVDLEEIKHGNW
jgi:hypothetical protein